MKSLFVRVSLLFACSASSLAQQATLQPSKDNTLYETLDGSTSNGAGEYLFAGRVGPVGGGAIRRALLKFDIAGSVPAGATVTSAVLTLNMSKSLLGTTTVELRKVSADWGEGTSEAGLTEGSGGASSTNDATWMHRFYNTSVWTVPGGDFVTTASASVSVAGAARYSWGSTAQMVADVQAWLDTPSSNFGWIVSGDESATSTAKRFDSRQNATFANRPSLQVTYATATAVDGLGGKPDQFSLEQNFPNPFNPSTTISFSLPVKSSVSLKVIDLFGREVATLASEEMSAGTHSRQWQAVNMPSGVYFFRLKAGELVKTQKMNLMK